LTCGWAQSVPNEVRALCKIRIIFRHCLDGPGSSYLQTRLALPVTCKKHPRTQWFSPVRATSQQPPPWFFLSINIHQLIAYFILLYFCFQLPKTRHNLSFPLRPPVRPTLAHPTSLKRSHSLTNQPCHPKPQCVCPSFRPLFSNRPPPPVAPTEARHSWGWYATHGATLNTL
jgi:hypothetical protein